MFLVSDFDRCQEDGSDERRKEKKEEKCPFLENSGSEEDVLQILQYMATILGKHMKFSETYVLCVHILYICLLFRKEAQEALELHISFVYDL